MFNFDSWIIPFTFIPGVGMLILSTSNRLYFVSTLIREIAYSKDHIFSADIEKLVKRTRHFHMALVLFYISIALMALAVLLGGTSNYLNDSLLKIGVYSANALTLIGILNIVIGTIYLVKESILASHIILNCEKTKQLLEASRNSKIESVAH